MRDAWTTPEAKAGRTRPSIRGRSARCHRPRIRWGMISRPMPRHRNRSTLSVPWSRPISPTRSTSRRSATGMPPCPCANGGAWPRPRAASCSRPASRSPACPRGDRMNPPRPHASWNRRRRTAPPPTLRRRKPNRSWSNISTATGSHRRKRSRPTSSPTRKPWKPSTSWPNNIPRASESPHVPPRTRKRPTPPHPSCKPSKRSTREISRG